MKQEKPASSINDRTSSRNQTTEAVTSILPLSPGQAAMWMYCQNVTDDDPGILHIQFTLNGTIDVGQLIAAWQHTVNQYESLRTTLHEEKSAGTLLVCRKEVTAQVEAHDWRHLEQNEQNLQFESLQIENEKRGLDLMRAPSSRLIIVQMSSQSMRVIWTCHHVLLDGWSAINVINSLVSNYTHVSSDQSRAPERFRYSDYRSWLKSRDRTQSEAYWRETLAGFHAATVLSGHNSPRISTETGSTEIQLLSSQEADAFDELCRRHALTKSSVLQAVWAALLSALCRQDDVAWGVASAGRTMNVTGIDTTVGFLANVFPVRVVIRDEETVIEWMKGLQTQLFEAQQNEFLSLPDIMQQAEPGCRHRCFDTLFVLENFPAIISDNAQLSLSDYQSGIVSGFPLTLTVVPGERWTCHCSYTKDNFSEIWINNMCGAYRNLLLRIPDLLQGPVSVLKSQCADIAPEHPNPSAMTSQYGQVNLREQLLDSIVGPTNTAELQMLGLWEELLQIKPLSMNSNFFDNGGNSLNALMLIAAIEKEFGERLPVKSLLESPTPIQLLDCLAQERVNRDAMPSIVPLNTHGTAPAVFCLHAGGGHALFYREFAQMLGSDQPSYALQPKGIDGFAQPISDSSEMADFYIEQILRVAPEGPYNLLCYCYGGALILEMAKKLRAMNRAIGHLIVIDTAPPMPADHPAARFGWNGFLSYEYIAKGRLDLLLSAIKLKLRKSFYRLSRNRQSIDDSLPRHLVAVQQACYHAFVSYRATPTPFFISVIDGVQEFEQHENLFYTSGWDTIAPNSERVPIDAHHRLLFVDPYVRLTCKAVSDILARPSPNLDPAQ